MPTIEAVAAMTATVQAEETAEEMNLEAATVTVRIRIIMEIILLAITETVALGEKVGMVVAMMVES